MNSKGEIQKNLSINISNINKKCDILTYQEQNKGISEKKNNNFSKENIIFGTQNKNYENINIRANIIQNIQSNENNNSIFIFNKNDEIDKIFNTENNSGLSLIKIMEEKVKDNKKIKKERKSSSVEIKKSQKDDTISMIKIKTPKKLRKNTNNLFKQLTMNDVKIENKIIQFEEENTKIVATAKVRKLSNSSDSLTKDNTNINNKNKNINIENNNNIYSTTNIDYILNLKVNNNIQKTIHEIKLLSDKYLFKSGDKIKEMNDYSNQYNNSIEKIKNNRYQHQNFANRVCLDSIEELYDEEEIDSKTKSKVTSNKTNSELNSLFLSEKNINSVNSCQNVNKYKINSPNSNYSNIKNNSINNTICISSKYHLRNNNIFDISSDEEEEKYKDDNNDKDKIINYIDNDKTNNFGDEQNNFDSNIFIRPLDTFINYEYENTNSFMNESDINKLFSSPNKKIISFIDNTSQINSNNYMLYNQKMCNSAINNNRFKNYILNEENDFNTINNNIFDKDKKEINNNKYYNKTYIKKTINRELSAKHNINNLKNLISPENLNKYYSSSFLSNKPLKTSINNTFNNNNYIKQNIEIKKLSIKIFVNDNIICNNLSNNNNILKFNNTIEYLNLIKNKKYVKNYREHYSYINKINIDLDSFSIEKIEKIRKIMNNNNSTMSNNDYSNFNSNKKNNINKKNEVSEFTLSSTVEKRNISSFNSFKNNYSEDHTSKLFIQNDTKSKQKDIKIGNNHINQYNKIPMTNNLNINTNQNLIKNLKLNIKSNHKKYKSRNITNNNNILFYNNSVNLYEKNNYNKENENDNNKYFNSFVSEEISYLDSKIKNNKKDNRFNNILDNLSKISIEDINKNNEDKKLINNNNNNNLLIIKDKKIKNNKLYISIKSYEELIKDIILKTNNLIENNNESNYNLVFNDKILENKLQNEIDNILLSFEKKLILLKNYYLCLLIQKHYAKTKSEKEKIIKDINIINKRELFYKDYLNLIEYLQEKLKYDNNQKKKIYFDKIINILEKYKTITKFDIKYTKKIYKKENKISPYNLNDKFIEKNPKFNKIIGGIFNNDFNTKKIIISTSFLLPIIYGINYLMSFYNQNQI